MTSHTSAMCHYEKFVVYPGPEYDQYNITIQRSGVPLGQPLYLINYHKSKNLDNCRYVCQRTIGGTPLLNWRIDGELQYIQLYWTPFGKPHRLENNKHVMIIRSKFRILFRCIARLIQLKKRSQVRIKTRQSFSVSGMFKLSIFAPVSHRVIAFI